MSNTCNSHGAQTRVFIEPGDSPHTFDGSSEIWRFNSCTLRKQGRVIFSAGNSGTRWRDVTKTRDGGYDVSGQLVCEVSPAMLDVWLPRLLGGSESPTDTWAGGETLPAFGVLVDCDDDSWQYNDCIVSSWALRGRTGGFIELSMNIVGKTAERGTAFPSVSYGTTLAYRPYAFTDAGLTIQSGSRSSTDFALSIDNGITPLRFHSLTAECFSIGEQTIQLNGNLKLNDTEAAALYGQDLDGAAASFTLTNGTVSTSFAMSRLIMPDNGPAITGKQPFYLPLVGEVVGADSTTAPLTIVNDATV